MEWRTGGLRIDRLLRLVGEALLTGRSNSRANGDIRSRVTIKVHNVRQSTVSLFVVSSISPPKIVSMQICLIVLCFPFSSLRL